MSLIHLLELCLLLGFGLMLASFVISTVFAVFSISTAGIVVLLQKNKIVGIAVLLVLLSLIGLGIHTSVNAKQTHSKNVSQTSPASYCKIDKTKFLIDLNNLRTSLGLSPVSEVADMDAVAQARVSDMLTNSYYGHYNPTTQESVATEIQSKTHYDNYGEVLDGPLRASEAFQDFKNSPEHYNLLVNPNLKYIGIDSRYQPSSVATYDNNGTAVPNSESSQFCIVEVPLSY